MAETAVALSLPSHITTKSAMSAMKVPKFRVPIEENQEMVLNDQILMEPYSDLTLVFKKVSNMLLAKSFG
jgi:hypothetical protein